MNLVQISSNLINKCIFGNKANNTANMDLRIDMDTKVIKMSLPSNLILIFTPSPHQPHFYGQVIEANEADSFW